MTKDGRRWAEMRRFRLVSFGRALAPWRATEAEAKQDAIETGNASRSGSQVYLTVPATIQAAASSPQIDAKLCARTFRTLRELDDSRLRTAPPQRQASAH